MVLQVLSMRSPAVHSSFYKTFRRPGPYVRLIACTSVDQDWRHAFVHIGGEARQTKSGLLQQFARNL